MVLFIFKAVGWKLWSSRQFASKIMHDYFKVAVRQVTGSMAIKTLKFMHCCITIIDGYINFAGVSCTCIVPAILLSLAGTQNAL